MQAQTGLGLALGRAREETDELFRLVRPEALYERPIPERNRIIFYLGHLEAFDWNLIGRDVLGRPAFDSPLDRLFAFGIDPPPGQLPADTPSDWPRMPQVEGYIRRTRDAIDGALDEVPEMYLHVALEHRLMHAETFAYMLHNLPYGQKRKPSAGSFPESGSPVRSAMIRVPGGPALLGRRRGEGFGWDNEFEAHTEEVPAFSIGRYKVTNGDYLEYVREGAAAPFFWTEHGGRWHYRGMFDEVPLPLDCPVYVTHREAEAYARRRGMRLPTEAEFQRAAPAAPAAWSDNFDFHHWDPAPVTAGDGSGADRARWWAMAGSGLPRSSDRSRDSKPFPFYPNYSAPFFDGQHYVIKGASPRTAACFTRPSFRNWFRPAYPYVYATFRLVQS